MTRKMKNIGSIILIVSGSTVSGDEVEQQGILRCLPRK
jgi:hypothetical protein